MKLEGLGKANNKQIAENRMKLSKIFVTIIMALIFASAFSMNTKAEIFYLNGGRQFDSDFYAMYYPDLKAKYGTNVQSLLNHYLDYGIFEGRIPSAIYLKNMDALAIGDTVPCALLYNRANLRKKCTMAEFQHAYNVALPVVNSLKGLPRVKQMSLITDRVANLVLNQVPYSTTAYHYNDPCGVFGDGTIPLGASCAGIARATGLCLNMLAIPYEHVNENTWKHQWCRVNINGVYYICDPYLGYMGPEPAPYKHPMIP